MTPMMTGTGLASLPAVRAAGAFRRQRQRIEPRLLIDQRDEEPDERALVEAGAGDRWISRVDLGDALGQRPVDDALTGVPAPSRETFIS